MSTAAVTAWIAESYEERSVEYSHQLDSPSGDVGDDGWECELAEVCFFPSPPSPPRSLDTHGYGYMVFVGVGATIDEAAERALLVATQYQKDQP